MANTIETDLPAELEGREFRVIVPEGGYKPFLEEVLEHGHPRTRSLRVLVRHETSTFFVHVSLSELKADINWKSSLEQNSLIIETMGQLLDIDSRPVVDMHVKIFLEIDLRIDQDGATGGSLRMWLERP